VSAAVRSVAIILAACVLTACASSPAAKGGRWHKTNTPESQVADDEGECRRRAGAEVDREVRRDEALRDAPPATAGSFETAMTRYEAERRIARLVESCMRRLGYSRAP
jgi:hypothetical protein